jgi:hypothetical protein
MRGNIIKIMKALYILLCLLKLSLQAGHNKWQGQKEDVTGDYPGGSKNKECVGGSGWGWID